jgi:hypothetical protein
MCFPAEVDVFEEQVGCKQQILGCAAGAENGAIIPDSELQAGPRRNQNLSFDAT